MVWIKSSVVVPVGNKMDWLNKQHSLMSNEKHANCYMLCPVSISVQCKIVNQYFFEGVKVIMFKIKGGKIFCEILK